MPREITGAHVGWLLTAAGLSAGLLVLALLAPWKESGHTGEPEQPLPTYADETAQEEAPPLVLRKQAPFGVVAGDVIELAGSGLGGGMAVTVGYKFVYGLQATDSLVTFIAPDMEAGSYDVAVSRADGKKAVLSKLLVYGEEDAIEASAGSLEVGSEGNSFFIHNLTARLLLLALVRHPAGYKVEMPSPRELPPGARAEITVMAGKDADEDYLVVQGGSTRVSVAVTPLPELRESWQKQVFKEE